MAQPTKFGRFEVTGELGKGAMGIVYLARDPLIDRAVAIKTLSPEGQEDGDLQERFSREARSAGILNHPNIITVYDVGDQEGVPFIALEYLEGKTLQEMIEPRSEMSLEQKVDILDQMSQGLDYAHERGVIHRDIKPGNIMICSDGLAKITDFGIARSGATTKTKAGVLLGSVGYMSPEQIKGWNLDRRSDIFSLGIVAYELLTGRRGYPGDNVPEVMNDIMNRTLAAPSEVDHTLPIIMDRVVGRALARDRDDRYPTALEFGQDLQRALESIKPDESTAASMLSDQISSEELFGDVEFHEPGLGMVTPRGRRVSVISLLVVGVLCVGLLAAVAGFLGFFGEWEYSRLVRHKLGWERADGDPDVATDLAEARIHFQKGHFEEAARKFSAILRRDPRNTDATIGLKMAKGKIEQANKIPELQRQASIALENGDFDGASDLYARILHIDPDNAEALAGERRVEELREITAEAEMLLAEAQDLFDNGEFRGAIRGWQKVFELDPGNPRAVEGIREARKQLTGNEDLDQLAEDAEKCFRVGDYAAAITMWRTVLEVQPDSDVIQAKLEKAEGLLVLEQQIDSWLKQAEEYFRQGEYQAAIRNWNQVLAWRPFDEKAHEGIRKARSALVD